MSHIRPFPRRGPLWEVGTHFFIDASDLMTEPAPSSSPSNSAAIYSRVWKTELEISRQGNCITLERIIEQSHLSPRGHVE